MRLSSSKPSKPFKPAKLIALPNLSGEQQDCAVNGHTVTHGKTKRYPEA